MKYEVDIIINKPRAEVVAKFDSVENLYHWMKGLQSFETYQGEAGSNGAKSKVIFQSGKRRIEMIETITDNSLPESMAGTYDAPGVHNIVINRFEEVDENTTRYVSDQEFQFKSLGMKFFGWLMPSAFKRQSMNYLIAFKNFVEKGTSVQQA